MYNRQATIAATVASYRTERGVVAAVRSAANYLIEQAERRARGLDKGEFRDDCPTACRTPANTIREQTATLVETAFALSAKFSKGTK